MPAPGLPAVISQTLAAFAGRQRLVLVVRGVGETVAVLVLGLASVAAIDALLRPSNGLHTILSIAAYGLAGGVLVGRALLPLLARPGAVDTAHAIERAAQGDLDERLSSAVELAGSPPHGVSAWMIERTVALAAREAADLDVARLVDPRPARLAWMRTGVVTVIICGACLVPNMPAFLARAAWPVMLRPSAITLDVQPGDQRLALGAPLEVKVNATPDPGTASVAVTWEDGVVETLALERGTQGTYHLLLPAVTRALRYQIQAGDAESRQFSVEVVQPPMLGKISLRITPPSYAGLPVRVVEGSGDAEVVAGSQVAITAELTGEPAAAGSVTSVGGEQPATILDGILHAELTPTANLAYGLRLIGANGLMAEPSQRWLLSVLPDHVPLAKLTGQCIEAGLVGPDEALLLDVEASDDLGLRALEVTVEVEGHQRAHRSIPIASNIREVKAPLALDLAGLGLKIGDALTITLKATDVGGQTALSTPLALSVAPGENASGAVLAARLRAILKQFDVQAEALKGMTRSLGGLARALRPEDSAAIRGDLGLLTSRIGTWAGELASAGGQLGEAVPADDALAPLLIAVGEECVAFARGTGDQVAAACAAGQAAVSSEPLVRGRELTESASHDLGGFRHDLALLIARLDANQLAAATQAAKARWQRALPIARGERGWRNDTQAPRPGLMAHFFKGRDFAGTAKHRAVLAPRFINQAWPVVGPDTYCIRFVGEVLVPKAGEWVFGLAGDDGVRLRVKGQSLLPGEAWKDQGLTEYRGRIHLEAGWHPIEIEYFQGGGNSGLNLRLGDSEGSLADVDVAQLRCREEIDRAALVRDMASVPRDQVEAGNERIRQGLAIAMSVPAAASAISDLVTNDQLLKLARASAPPGERLQAQLPQLADWPLATLDAADQDGGTLVAAAQALRDLLATQVDHDLHDRVTPGDLSALRQDLARLRDRITRLRAIPERLQAQDRLERLGVEATGGRAWIDQLGREALRCRLVYLDTARRPGAGLASRAAALHGARALAGLADGTVESLAKLTTLPTMPREVADRLQDQHQRLADLLKEAESWEAKLRKQEIAAEAAKILPEVRKLAAQPAHGKASSERQYRQLAEKVRDLADRQRAAGDKSAAAQLSEPLGKTLAQAKLGDLAGRLEERAREANDWYSGLDQAAVAQLKTDAERLAKEEGHPAQATKTTPATATDLDAVRLALAVEAEHRKQESAQSPVAKALARLATDVGASADADRPVSAKEVKEFSERAAALVGQRGDQARDAEVASAKQADAKAPAPASEAEHLDELAAQANAAADKPTERAGLVEALKDLADDAPADHSDPGLPAERQQTAERLTELVNRDRELVAEEQAARTAFAQAEHRLADNIPAIVEQAKAAADQAADPQLAEALRSVQKELPASAAAAKALGETAASPPAPASDPARADAVEKGAAEPSSTELVADANRLADRIEAEVSKPLAERFQAQDAAKDPVSPPVDNPAAQVGLAVAELVAEQRAAAERLDEVVARRAANSEALAETVQEASALLTPAEPTETVQPATQADAAEQKADQAQTQADLAQDKADAAQAAADAAVQQALKAQEAAQQAAQGNDQGRAQEAEKKAAESTQKAAEAQQAAVEAQHQALDTQLAAIAAAPLVPTDGSVDPEVAERQAQVATQLAQVERNSAQALDNALIAPLPAPTIERAEENRQRAAQALEQAGEALPAAALELASQLAPPPLAQGDAPLVGAPGEQKDSLAPGKPAAEPASVPSSPSADQATPAADADQAAKAAEADQAAQAADKAGQPQPAVGKPSQAAVPPGAPHAAPPAATGEQAASEAAAKALTDIQGAPDQAKAYQQAAKTLAAAAAQARLTQQIGNPNGPLAKPAPTASAPSAPGTEASPTSPPAGGESQPSATNPGAPGAISSEKPPAGVDGAAWARAQAAARTNVRSAGVELFSEEHQEAIRAYLQRLGEEQ